MPSRRAFLSGLGAGVAALGLPRAAMANDPGPYNILEIYLSGAIAHRETFWTLGSEAGSPLDAVNGSTIGSAQRVAMGVSDGAGGDLYLGRGCAPFASRAQDLRLVTMAMDTGVHEIGHAYAFTGLRLGRADATSIGSRIQHHIGGAGIHSVILDGVRNQLLTRMATRTGDLGSAARPLVVPMGSVNLFGRLERGEQQHRDPMTSLYRDRYAARLTHSGEQVRSAHFDLYSDGFDRMANWTALQDLLTDGPGLPLVETAVSRNSYVINPFTESIRFGARLIAEKGVRHVCTFASGNNLPGSLDTHDGYEDDPVGHNKHHNAALWGACNTVEELIGAGIDLSTTIVVIHTEFGRYKDSDGSEHSTPGYCALMLGGPVVGGVQGTLTGTDGGKGGATTIDESSLDGGVTPKELADALSIAAGADAMSFPDTPVLNDDELAHKVFGLV